MCAFGIDGRPGLQERQRQYRRKPRLCQPMTVSGFTITKTERQTVHLSKGPPRTSVPRVRHERVSDSERRLPVAVVRQGSLSRASREFGTASEVTTRAIGHAAESPPQVRSNFPRFVSRGQARK